MKAEAKGLPLDQDEDQDLAFFWLARRTFNFFGFYMNYNKEAKSLTFRRGSEVSQEEETCLLRRKRSALQKYLQACEADEPDEKETTDPDLPKSLK